MALLSALAGCFGGRGEGVFPFAVGARAELSPVFGPCRSRELSPAGIVRFARPDTSPIFDAVHPGEARVPCRDGTLVLSVRYARRLQIEPASFRARTGERVELRAYGIDGDGERVELGAWSEVTWSYEGALGASPDRGCRGHIIPHCPPGNAGLAVVTRSGRATVRARFGSLQSRLSVTVAPLGGGPPQ